MFLSIFNGVIIELWYLFPCIVVWRSVLSSRLHIISVWSFKYSLKLDIFLCYEFILFIFYHETSWHLFLLRLLIIFFSISLRQLYMYERPHMVSWYTPEYEVQATQESRCNKTKPASRLKREWARTEWNRV